MSFGTRVACFVHYRLTGRMTAADVAISLALIAWAYTTRGTRA